MNHQKHRSRFRLSNRTYGLYGTYVSVHHCITTHYVLCLFPFYQNNLINLTLQVDRPKKIRNRVLRCTWCVVHYWLILYHVWYTIYPNNLVWARKVVWKHFETWVCTSIYQTEFIERLYKTNMRSIWDHIFCHHLCILFSKNSSSQRICWPIRITFDSTHISILGWLIELSNFV